MLKNMLSGTAIALLLAAAPAYAQTEQTEEPAAQEGQTDTMEAQDSEAPADEEDAGAQSELEGEEDADGDTAQGDAMESNAETDAAQDDTMESDTDTDAAATDEGGIDDSEMAGSVDQEPTETFIQSQAEEEVLASELMGANVENSEGDNLGSINDVLVHDEIGVKAVVIGVGGFLGIGQKNVAVNYEEIEQVRNEDGAVTLVFSATTEELENAPEFVTYEQELVEAEQGAPDAGMGGTGGGMGGAPAPAPAPAE